LELSAEQFIVERSASNREADAVSARGASIIAGYPWFSDWGRDALIAARGLLVAQGRINLAVDILKTWGATLRRGLIANTFAESGGDSLYNSADASLWFVILAHEVNELIKKQKKAVSGFSQVVASVREILDCYTKGTDFNIAMDDDALLKAGDGKSQVTWMDAKVRDVMVTPRVGKPVEIQALWVNALRAGNFLLGESSYLSLAQRAEESFNQKFWNQKNNSLYDVVDMDGLRGQNDDTIRLNQVFACGGLIWPIVPLDRSKLILRVVEEQLLTPMGLRTLSPNSSSYLGRYNGSQPERDIAYHQGSVWPWPMGAFVDAWLRVRGYSDEAKLEARERFAHPLEVYFSKCASLFELADGDQPHTPRGCPFQAWSLGEMIRILKMCEVGKEPSNN
jgi:predicted glycogen debranching enzyme